MEGSEGSLAAGESDVILSDAGDGEYLNLGDSFRGIQRFRH